SARGLGRLALEGTQWLQRDRGSRVGVVRFFTRSFPRAFRSLGGPLAVATLLLVASALIGVSPARLPARVPPPGRTAGGGDAAAGVVRPHRLEPRHRAAGDGSRVPGPGGD